MSFRALSRLGLSVSFAALAIPACSSQSPMDQSGSQGNATTAQASPRNFIVVYKTTSIPASAVSDITAAGGTIVAIYKEIGVITASSASTTFDTSLAGKTGVYGVSHVTGLAAKTALTKLPGQMLPAPAAPATTGEPLAPMQWDMDQIHASQARAINTGSKSVVVGVIDSGIDDTVVDLQGQVDHSLSASCMTGAADTTVYAWQHDVLGHGTHVAGTIGAKKNGAGIVGIAPGVRLAAVKVSENGFVYPDAFICAVYWGATHGFKLANASLFTDPWYYACPSDSQAGPILLAQQRVINFASKKGMTIIAAAGNENQNLGYATVDPFSPTDAPSPPVSPAVTSACKLMPVMLDNVIGVSSVGANGNLAYYSNYGNGSIDVTAPGGDLHNGTPGDPGGQIVSDIPWYSDYYQWSIGWGGRVGIGPNCPSYANLNDTTYMAAHPDQDPTSPSYNPANCPETYAMLQGTSMATPHATGVAALALSVSGDLTTSDLTKLLASKAVHKACPANPYQPYPADMPAETCTGSTLYNGFYGNGEVDALKAVTQD